MDVIIYPSGFKICFIYSKVSSGFVKCSNISGRRIKSNNSLSNKFGFVSISAHQKDAFGSSFLASFIASKEISTPK